MGRQRANFDDPLGLLQLGAPLDGGLSSVDRHQRLCDPLLGGHGVHQRIDEMDVPWAFGFSSGLTEEGLLKSILIFSY